MNRKNAIIPVLFVAALSLAVFMPLSGGGGRCGDDLSEASKANIDVHESMSASEVLAVEVIPVNTTLRDALARFSLFYNDTYYDIHLKKNVSRLSYRLAGDISEWESVVYYFWGLPLVLDGDVTHKYMANLDVKFGLPDYAPLSYWRWTARTHRNPELVIIHTHVTYDSLDDQTTISWYVTAPGHPTDYAYVEPDAWIPVAGSWLFIDLHINSETQLDNLRIGLSLYLRK